MSHSTEDCGYVLRYLGDPVLTMPCAPVGPASPVPAGLIDAMRDVLSPTSPRRRLADGRAGAGLAANQVGGQVRVILVRVSGDVIVMVNPEIRARSDETQHLTEGCLSIPAFATSVRRHQQIAVYYRDEDGAERGRILTGEEAQCVQHEIDHLDGKLITDGLPRQQRRRAERIIMDLTVRATRRCA